jgi:hypothetical protein
MRASREDRSRDVFVADLETPFPRQEPISCCSRRRSALMTSSHNPYPSHRRSRVVRRRPIDAPDSGSAGATCCCCCCCCRRRRRRRLSPFVRPHTVRSVSEPVFGSPLVGRQLDGCATAAAGSILWPLQERHRPVGRRRHKSSRFDAVHYLRSVSCFY